MTRLTTRRLVALAFIGALFFAGCSGVEETATDPTGSPNPTLSESAEPSEDDDSGRAGTPEVQIPDTPAGDQLSWFLGAVPDAPLPEAELKKHFNAGFLEQVPADQFNEILGALGDVELLEIAQSQPSGLVALVRAAGQEAKLSIGVDADGKIETWLLRPAELPEEPASWSDLDARLKELAPDVGFLAAEVSDDGACVPVHAVAPDELRPIGSMFKLYVLDAVGGRIAEGDMSWDDELTITPEAKSWPSGDLQERPDGDRVTVAEAAELMISISDNTATDLLVDAVGREAVENALRSTSEHVEPNIPMLKTKEFFTLKTVDYPKDADSYLAMSVDERRAWLDGIAEEKLPDPTTVSWSEPVAIDTIEWFASPTDLCAAYLALLDRDDETLAAAMSKTDGGLRQDEEATETWPEVWFKGGSEPGVLALSYLAEAADGRRYFTTVLVSDPDQAFSEADVALELTSLAKGALTMMNE